MDGEGIDLGIGSALLPRPMRISRDAFNCVDQKILKSCGYLIFSADAKSLAALSL
jgi:hypothetical protein